MANEGGELAMQKPESAIKTIFKLGIVVVVAAAVGGWATRRIGISSLWRGLLRGGVAMAAAIALRKKSKTLSLGLGTYAIATAVEGWSMGMETDRYMRSVDATGRQPLNQANTTGAPAAPSAAAPGAPAAPPASLPAGNAVTDFSARAYQAAGYTVV